MKLFIVFSLLIILTVFQEKISSFSLNIPSSPGYYQDGDFVIGGLFSLQVTQGDTRTRFGFHSTTYIPEYVYIDFTKHYQHLLAMVFAIETINKDPNILFNLSLGFYLFNVNFIEMKAMESSMALISGESPPTPNYSCRPEKSDKLVAVIGGISAGISTQISRVLSLYNVPQMSYAPYNPSLGTGVQPQPPYQFPVNTAALNQGIIQLLLYFDWVWVGLVVPDDMRGEIFLRNITEEMTKHRLCVAFAEKVPEFPAKDTTDRQRFLERFTLTNVIVVFGDTYSLLRFVYNIFCNSPLGNVWITTSDWDITILPFGQSLSYTYFGGGLSFSDHMDELLGFKDFLRGVQPGKYPHDIFIQDVWSNLFECPYLDGYWIRNLSRCEQNGTLASRALHVWDMNTSPPSYKVHAAVNAIAQALREELLLRAEAGLLDKRAPGAPPPWKIPFSICSPSCILGFRKTPLEGKPFCCFNCLPCPQGEIANETGVSNTMAGDHIYLYS
ncbi:Vmn2r27 [Phodopus roborovskii]|uniref:Parathyroid cell calcium-sensing receptor n=1 Tax=Phodopus roborovskii TaxID=109678 RepID=A0AAU9YUH9_PHORO|nr:Vmn2r27 [Phodopus roborovskii]